MNQAAAQLARMSKLYEAQEISRLAFEEAQRRETREQDGFGMTCHGDNCIRTDLGQHVAVAFEYQAADRRLV